MSRWKAGGVRLPHGPYMIGAGVCKTPASTADWLRIAPVVSGSYTADQRDGNHGNLAWPETFEEVITNGYALNSYGMPNIGYAEASAQLSSFDSEQPLIVSVAGFEPSHYLDGVLEFSRNENTAAIELNFGCPNTQGDHPDIISFNQNVMREILTDMSEYQCTKPIWIKLSPYSNPAELKRMAEDINAFSEVLQLAVVTCNTFPNAYAGEGKVSPNGGLAGLSGPALKPIALGQVRQFRQHLNPSVDVIGVGGVTTGDDVIDFLDAGAAAVQITSLAHWVGRPGSFFDHLLDKESAGRLLKHIEENM